MLEKGLQLFELQTFKKDEVKWYHIMFLDMYYDEDTDLVYVAGLNAVPVLFAAIVLLACGTMIPR